LVILSITRQHADVSESS